jgi:hypothetical protein
MTGSILIILNVASGDQKLRRDSKVNDLEVPVSLDVYVPGHRAPPSTPGCAHTHCTTGDAHAIRTCIARSINNRIPCSTPKDLPVNCQIARNNSENAVKIRVESTAPEDRRAPVAKIDINMGSAVDHIGIA